jgi:mono/diheme cytochrome c family protein
MRTWMLMAILMAPAAAWADAPNPQIERTWKAKCASCHGADGKGQTEQGKKAAVGDMTSADWQKKFTDDQLKAAINDGLKRDKNGVKQEMEAYKGKLRPDQIDGLVAYVRGLKK